MSTVALVAPAKLTVSLKVRGRRDDGYHDLESEMVSIDLCDRLFVDPDSHGLDVVGVPGTRAESVPGGPDNLVARALAVSGRSGAVRVEKHIPVGGGLGGGSADAAAILRWAGVDDPSIAARLGADVPFCVRGGRAIVEGIGERVSPLPFEPRAFVLLVPPFAVDTAAVYKEWDRLDVRAARLGPGAAPRAIGHRHFDPLGLNELMDAAIAVEPRLAPWGELLGETSGVPPVLAGSGSTWWVQGTPEELGLAGRDVMVLGRDEGRLIPVRTVPAGWSGPSGTSKGPRQGRGS